jgi:hypothetical protein
MSGVQQKRSPEDKEQLLAWCKIRDKMMGSAGVSPQFRSNAGVIEAIALAVHCEHPLAVWLTSLFAGRDVKTKMEAMEVFSCSLLCCCAVHDLNGFRRAAELGDAFAQSWMAWHTHGERSLRFAEQSAAQGERDGFYQLGYCFAEGKGCVPNAERAKENFLLSTGLGHGCAMIEYSMFFGDCDPQRFVWLEKAAVVGEGWCFMQEMKHEMKKSYSERRANIVFAIGRAVKRHVDFENVQIFRQNHEGHDHFIRLHQVVHFYKFQLMCYRKAVDCWTVVGLRNNIVKDIRNMIGKMVGALRDEAEYECYCQLCKAEDGSSVEDDGEEEEELLDD